MADQERQQHFKEAGICISCRKPVTGYTTRCDSCNVHGGEKLGPL